MSFTDYLKWTVTKLVNYLSCDFLKIEFFWIRLIQALLGKILEIKNGGVLPPPY